MRTLWISAQPVIYTGNKISEGQLLGYWNAFVQRRFCTRPLKPHGLFLLVLSAGDISSESLSLHRCFLCPCCRYFFPGVFLGPRRLGFAPAEVRRAAASRHPPPRPEAGLDEPRLNLETSAECFHKGGAEVLLSTIQKWRFMNGRTEASRSPVCKSEKAD